MKEKKIENLIGHSNLKSAAGRIESITDERERNISFFNLGKTALGLGDFELAKTIINKMSTENPYLRYSLAREIAKKTANLEDFETSLALAEEGMDLDAEEEKKKEKAFAETEYYEKKFQMPKLSIAELAIWAARAGKREFVDKVLKKIDDPAMMARFTSEAEIILKTGKGTWSEEGGYEGINIPEKEQRKNVVSEASGTADVPEKKEELPREKGMTKKEYKNYVKTGQISEEILTVIAQKIRNGVQPSLEEMSVYAEHSKKIEEIIVNIKKKEEATAERDWAFTDEPKKVPSPETKTPEEKEAVKEIEKLSPEDREKIGWGLATIGFKVEERKNILFASALEKGVARMTGEKNVLGRFVKELRDSFVRDAQNAAKKAKGEDVVLKQFGDKVTLAGNILKYGRMVTDLTGASLASPLRYVMMGGMATSRLAEAAKETRLKSESVMEKTRIKDAELAAKEAWKIYADARKREGKTEGEDVSVESFKKSYLVAMPKDLLERISRETKTTDGFLQEIISLDLQLSIERLNKKINKIENSPKLSAEQKEQEKEKLLLKERKNLEDYDRIVTQYGTVDELAMASRYAQTMGKAIVAGVQIETLFLSAQRLSETITNLFHHSGAPEVTATAKIGIHSVDESQASGSSAEVPTGVSVAPGTGHEITNDFSIKLGEDGVPKNLETVFSAIAANHMTLPADGTINEESAAKILNVAANLTKLTEGHGAAGITAEEWSKAGNFWKGELEIKDHDAFNKILEKLQANADKNWTNGVLQSKGAASSYVSNINQENWLKIMHADGLDKAPGGAETGILGHDEVTGDKIKDFGHGKILKAEDLPDTPRARIDELNENVIKTQEELRAKEILEKMERGDAILPDERISAEAPQNPSGLSVEEKNAILLDNPMFAHNPYNLSENKVWEAYEANEKNIKHLFGNNSSDTWKQLKDIPAKETLEQTTGNETKVHMSQYLRLLASFSEVEPEANLIKTENTGEYVARALQKLTADGNLEVFQQSLRK